MVFTARFSLDDSNAVAFTAEVTGGTVASAIFLWPRRPKGERCEFHKSDTKLLSSVLFVGYMSYDCLGAKQ